MINSRVWSICCRCSSSGALIVLMLFSPYLVWAGSDASVLGDIKAEQQEGQMRIRIEFAFPMRYVSHLPLSAAREVQIKLAPLSTANMAESIKFNRENRKVPLSGVSVRYVGSSVGGPYLRIYFPGKTECTIRQGKDFRSLEILVASSDLSTSSNQVRDISDITSAQILEEANGCMAAEEYPRAIQLYTKLTERSSPRFEEIAQALLADARVANGQLAHAKAEYMRYLELFPDGDKAEKVKRKLLELSGEEAMDALGTSVAGTGTRQQLFGEISQFYGIEGCRLDDEGYEQDVSILDTDFDLRYTGVSADYEIAAVINGGYEQSLMNDYDNQSWFSSLYLEAGSKNNGLAARVGRSYENRSGVWGRYDGGAVSLAVGPDLAVNGIAGYPVVSSYDDVNTDAYFYGSSVDYSPFENIDMNTFYFLQETEGLTDRQAIGGEVQYSYGEGTIFGLVDYDIFHEELSMMLMTGTYHFMDATMFTISGEYRKSPFLTTQNALIGQDVFSVDDLLLEYSEDEIKQLAKDRSADSTTAYLGIYHIFSTQYQLGFDVTWSKLGGTEISGGVDGYDGTDDEFYYLLQMTGEGLLASDDIWTVNLRYSDTTNYDIYGFRMYTRLRMSEKLLLVPEMNLQYRVHKEYDVDRVGIAPELRIEYKVSEQLTVELDCGYARLFDNDEGYSDQSDEYFLYVGYYWNF